MRLADRCCAWRSLIPTIALALGALVVLGIASRLDPEDRAGGGSQASIHVKFRSDACLWRHTATCGPALPWRPVFSHRHVDPDRTLSRWWDAEVAAERAEAVVADLERSSEVEEAFIVPETSLPSIDRLPPGDDGDRCPIQTPSFESNQGYLGPAPQGIDAPAAWARGSLGAGVWFADVEGNWNSKHEDLPGDRISHVGGRLVADPSWRAHGTAVLGEVVGRDNGKGVTGIAPDVERVFTSSIGQTWIADAIDAAAEQLRPGDVLLIELQSRGPRGRYLPVEFWDDNFDAIHAATGRGIIVVEAAGNGGENLDRPEYHGKLERKTRDSGAIMVGAGGPAREGFVDRARLDFSNYGSRLDLQGWGRKVATLDYGDLQRCSGDERDYTDRHYTDEFAGTSSASPIVAGAAVLVESYAKARGNTLPPAAVRELLTRTGTPQDYPLDTPNERMLAVGTASEPIGPRPDLERALSALPF